MTSRRAACFLPLVISAVVSAQPADLTMQPYVGMTVRDSAGGPVVGWVYPGPLGGAGFDSRSGLRRGDNLVSVNGQSVDAAGFLALVKSLKPGDTLTIVARRSPQSDPQAAIPTGGPGGEEFTISVAVASQENWAGTLNRGLRDGANIPEPSMGEFEAAILDRASQAGVRTADGGLDALLAYLAKTQDSQLDWNSLPAVVNALRRPLSLDADERPIAAAARAASGGDRAAIVSLIAQVLDVPDPGSMTGMALNGYIKTCYFAEGQQRSDQQDHDWWGDAESLERRMRDEVDIYDADVEAHIRTIRMSGKYAQGRIMSDLRGLTTGTTALERLYNDHKDGAPLEGDAVPADVRSAVTGDILAFEIAPDGRTKVLGGPGDNTYDLSRISEVYDLGGNDVYRYSRAPDRADPLRNARNQIVIDLAGDDRYESTDDFCGPGVGNFGLSLVDDRAGDDTYQTSGVCALASGLFGVGIILDHAGNDTYENTGPHSGWSLGTGFYGCGLIVDCAGSDRYLGEILCEGVGGPRGFGAIIDSSGNDLYRANGPHFGSAYGTPGVFLGLSQGFGYGIRNYAAGGVGALYDFGGDDRYEAGEFSQGGGYFFGLGILHDAEGRDLYYGNRYGQAFAAHQAAGLLIDDAGDDTYWSMTAASQAGTWDQSVGMLIDRAGNDTYRADGLAQGSAAMQALAVLIDGGGDDVYSAAGDSCQGQSGGNEYHFNADRVYSFSALLDLGPGADRYSSGRANGSTSATGKPATDPQSSPLYGVFSDEK